MADLHKLFESGEDVEESSGQSVPFIPETASASGESMEQPISLDEQLRQIGRGSMAGLESIGRGASLGLSDEMAAALGAGIEKRHETRPFSDIYQDILKYTRAHEAQQEEEFPKTTTAGELLGAATMLPVSPASVPGQIALGGAVGGLGAAGLSEAPITSPEFRKEVALGTGLGVAIPSVIAGGKALSRVGPVQDLIEMFKRGVKGEALVGRGAQEEVSKEIAGASKGISSELRSEEQRLGKLKERLLRMQESAGKQIDVGPALNKIEQDVAKLPEDTAKQIAEKTRLQELLNNFRQAKEQRTVVMRGELVPSGEDVALESLQKKLAVLNAKKEAGEPLKEAEKKLLKQYSKRELSVDQEALENPIVPYSPKSEVSSVGERALTSEGPQGEPLVQLLKDIEPGEIKIYTDPASGKKIMYSLDEGTGKLITQPVPEQAAYTPVKFKTEEITAPKSTIVSPQRAEQMKKAFSEQTKLGEESLKTGAATATATGATKELGATALPSTLEANKLITNIKGGIETLGLKDVQRPEEAVEKLMPFIQKLGGETGSSDIANRVLDEAEIYLRKANPKIADKIVPQMKDLARKYDLTRKTTRLSIAPGLIQQFLGTGRALGLSGSNLAGRGLGGTIKFLAELPPERLSNIAAKLQSRYGKSADRLTTIFSRLPDKSERGKNALIFAALQDPSHRQMLRAVGELPEDENEFSSGEEVNEE